MSTKTLVAGYLAHKEVGLAWVDRYHGWLHYLAVTVLSFAVLSVAIQLALPYDKSLPFLQIDGVNLGLMSRAQIEEKLAEMSAKGVTHLETPSKTWVEPWQTIGVSIDPKTSADAAVRYDLWERLIPFTSIAKVSESKNSHFVVLADDERVEEFVKKLVAEDRAAAKESTIYIKDGQVIIDESKNGYMFNKEYLKTRLKSSAIPNHERLVLVPEDVPPIRSTKNLQSLRAQADVVLAKKLTLNVQGKTFTPTRQQIGGWIDFADNKDKRLVLTFNSQAIKKYLEVINKDVLKQPGTSIVTLLDGVPIERTNAPKGRSLAINESTNKIISALKAPEPQTAVALNIQDVPPKESFVRTYSSSNAGLQAIVKDWNNQFYGDFGVIVRELGGKNRSAQWQADKSFVTASTFKLFVYFAVNKKIQAGEFGYDKVTDMGWRVDSCLEEMIVRSTNPCAISLMNLIGWQWAQDQVAKAGFSKTFINNKNGGDKFSTVRDETNFMMRLNSGTLMNKEGTDRLLGYLKRQIWRRGIPYGVPAGVTVADKVGFYNGWIHDIAIVYGPKSTYILGIMSRGGTDPAFAELSRRVYSFFNN